ncbi:hypothetical protein C1638_017600 [Chryseobacterium oncorhynchi]|uniref:Uncharacterized protein n=2 Tax=Chryseobacterium oncorhynchi TaxID=741074 RepID=A0A316WT31_9FLAO|nr:hypothetical protein C1638_017600 [Chryseobacterium oncorhynchi]
MAVEIQGREYEWGDLTLILGNRDMVRYRGIKYTSKIEREAVYAKGSQPVAIQSGNEAYEGEITMLQSEYQKLVKAGGGSIFPLMLDGLQNYGNPTKGDAMITDRIESLRFTEASKELKQGDKFMEITLPFIALNIEEDI